MRLGKKGELVFSVGPSGRRSLAVKSAKRSKHENSQLFYWSEKPTPQEDSTGPVFSCLLVRCFCREEQKQSLLIHKQ